MRRSTMWGPRHSPVSGMDGSSHELNRYYHSASGSGGMEVAAAEMLWDRSLDCGFRYTAMVLDGDSRSYRRLTEMNVYSDDVTITKEQFVNHVSRKMGTGLTKLVALTKETGVTLGEHGHGKLMGETIQALTVYYDRAIRSHHDDLDGMENAVFASFYHVSSTDAKPQHDRCPQTKERWCFYQKALAEGGHKNNIRYLLSPEVAVHVEGVYLCLSDCDLLSHCLRSATQNPNESLHTEVWAKCPKTGFV